MKHVGLVTYYNNNYGSILQCFASKHFIENLGYKCHVLYETSHYSYIRIIRKCVRLLLKIINDPSYLCNQKQMKNAMKAESLLLSPISKRLMDDFVLSFISPEGYTWGQLCDLGKKSKYICFITGSDQVWNASRGIPDIFFLRFCPLHKRIALAISFGVKTIPAFNSYIKKYIKEFNTLSVREDVGLSIIGGITSKDISRIADPAFIYSREEWLTFFTYGKKKRIPKNFILVHFLNAPNEIALSNIVQYSTERHLKIVAVGYKHKQFNNVKGIKFVDVSPIDYVNFINESNTIFTDSFHTTLFSVNFEKCFYTYERQYLHNYSQSSRIIEFLERFNLKSRLILSLEQFDKVPTNYVIDSTLLQCERKTIRDFINMVFVKADAEKME